MSTQPVDIQIFGRTLRVNCPKEKKDELHQAAKDLTQRIQELKLKTKVTNIEQLIFIAALNISNELTQEKLKIKEYTANIEQRVRLLQHTIDQTFIEQNYTVEYTPTKSLD
ncbi:cell division protein ZapA [Candidatus Schneideria nysicola]|uniref:cell division protein ZapA n=1 Tax=Candidatus Schneideria nysicola TaxID=1081631 RepID=UPI001CAA73BE|nr:cell division protein ZapA [Candidatus Schneideria nysicola]UAJ65108.1 cell division protein ZapA [Candidatus Schneideria nysicola]UAJ65641.1 cell division protein ZapA [Candidatus Schneideria nysicola]UAJ66169.1 cell division protein ZapA [Candidatus Schneideria nysicola]